MHIRKLLPIVAVAALAGLPIDASPLQFAFSLSPAADLSALPGETIAWDLRTENDDPSLFLSIDAVNWTAMLDSSQGTADNFSAFLFPLIAPSTVETDALFSIAWDPAATLGYSVSSAFIVSSSFCQDASYDGCVSNSDISLPFVATVGEPAPEPGSAAPIGFALMFAVWIVRRRRAESPCDSFGGDRTPMLKPPERLQGL